MNEQEKALLHLNAQIAKLPPSDRAAIQAIACTIRILIQADRRAELAVCLIGAELAAQ